MKTWLKVSQEGPDWKNIQTSVLHCGETNTITELQRQVLHQQLDGIIYKLNGGQIGKVSNNLELGGGFSELTR